MSSTARKTRKRARRAAHYPYATRFQHPRRTRTGRLRKQRDLSPRGAVRAARAVVEYLRSR